ncbi:Superfamily II DNA and RNA helicase [Parafrankia irregularis]|uniref:RNA helicase n=1 Tax=Parafrankia irregularis TaxID=795642 RepID=A0A0S4R1W1_9ACTN|nr:Superfamily II DNA and RNA helicase [Parafrankia irregularis]
MGDVPAQERPEAPLFAEIGVRPETVAALAEVGIVRPFAIQELTLPLALARTDIIGQARTGTGKTLAFGIPVVQVVQAQDEGADGRPQALVVVPTRELCVQVTADIARAGLGRGLRVLSVYGGRAYEPQLSALRSGVDIVVGTPGRLLDLARQKALDLARVRTLVLDEADEMLDLGFLPDVERIIAFLPEQRHTMLFSATMPGPVIGLARRFMSRPVHVRAEQPDEGRTVPNTQQHVFRAHALDKMEVLARLLQATDRGLAMVFVRTRRTADKVADDLARRGFAAAAVHGDLGQGQREQALRAFRGGKVDVLVATDVAARGIDVGGVTHVVNYQCPEDENVYLHRIGRTGRAGGSGVAITFVDWDDLPRWTLVNKALALPFEEPLETYSTSPHLFELLAIPADVKGSLPHSARTRAGLAAEEVEDLGGGGRRGTRQRTRERDQEEKAVRPARTRVRQRTRGAGAAAAATGLTVAGEADADTVEGTDPGPVSDVDVDTNGAGLAGRAATVTAVRVLGGDSEDGAVELTATDSTDEPARRRRRRRGGRGRGTGSVRDAGAESGGDGDEDSGAETHARRAESA